MQVIDSAGSVLQINAPEWFRLPAFRGILVAGRERNGARIATFHEPGVEPSTWSDVFIPFDAYPADESDPDQCEWIAEGSNLCAVREIDEIWAAITLEAKRRRLRHGIVWLTNIPETNTKVPK